jgi:glutaredoxin
MACGNGSDGGVVKWTLTTQQRSLGGLLVLVLAVNAGSSLWARHYQTSLGETVAQRAQPGDIQMLSSDSCSICVVARHWFTAHGVAFSECSIERDAVCRQKFEVSLAPGTPVVIVRGQMQVGFNAERVAAGLGLVR